MNLLNLFSATLPAGFLTLSILGGGVYCVIDDYRRKKSLDIARWLHHVADRRAHSISFAFTLDAIGRLGLFSIICGGTSIRGLGRSWLGFLGGSGILRRQGRSLWNLCRDPWYAGLLTFALLFPFALRRDLRDARKRRLGQVLNGANVICRSLFHRHARHHTGVGWKTTDAPSAWERLFLTRSERTLVRIARQHETEHILFIGDTGTGKSSHIRQLLIQIRDRGETAIVYDPAREYLPQFFNPERGDIVLNPLDARMPYWSPSDELLHPSEADAIAKSLYPDRDHENRFFVESPRKILAHLLKYRPTPEELCDWIARPDPEIDRRVAGTPSRS